MAKKRLTTAIEKLVNSLDSLPPEFRQKFKQQAMAILPLSKALEDGSGVRQAETQITSLEGQIAKLELQLKESNKEVEAFRAEKKKQEEKDREIDLIQFQILERLGSPATCAWLNLGQIARDLNIPVDEAEIYIEGLDGLGLVFYHPHEPGGGGWLRTAEGNRLVVAKRWAGGPEEEKPKKKHKHPDLPERQHAVLVALGSDLDGLTEQTIAEKSGP